MILYIYIYAKQWLHYISADSNSARFTDDSPMYHWQMRCVGYIDAYTPSVLSQHSLVYRSTNRMRCFSWRYFVHFKVFRYVT